MNVPRAAAAKGPPPVPIRRARAPQFAYKNPFFDERPSFGIVSDYAKRYARLLANPYDEELVGLPNSPVLNTRTSRVWNQGTFESGTAGVGFVVADPLAAAAGDNTCVITSTNTYATNAIDTTGAVGTASFNSNSEYLQANFGPGMIEARVVAAGLRVWNQTNVLALGGQVAGIHHPSHTNLNGYTQTALSQLDEHEIFSGKLAADQKISVVYRPVDTDDNDFVTAVPNINSAGHGYMGFIVTNPVATPQVYGYEFYVDLEFLGQVVRGKAVSPSDPIGHDAVVSTAQLASPIRKPHATDSRQLADHHERAVEAYASGHMSHGGHKSEPKGSASDTVNSIFQTLGTVGSVLGMFL